MKISKDQITHLASLARLEVTEAEKEKYAEQISDILLYLNQLNDLDLTKVVATDHITGQINVLRPDEVHEISSSEELLKVAPEVKNGHIYVKPVFEKK